MSRLNDIKTNVATLIAGITIANGYGYDVGSVNEPNLALCTFPAFNMDFDNEKASPDEKIAYYGYSNIPLKITISIQLTDAAQTPTQDGDDQLFQCVQDLRAVLGITNAALALSYYPCVVFVGASKPKTTRNGEMLLYQIEAEFSVKYQFSEQG
jgi:hypothetical protein